MVYRNSLSGINLSTGGSVLLQLKSSFTYEYIFTGRFLCDRFKHYRDKHQNGKRKKPTAFPENFNPGSLDMLDRERFSDSVSTRECTEISEADSFP